MSAVWPIQVALATRLTGNAPLMARVTGIHDGRAPEGAVLPYVVISEPSEEDWGTLGKAGNATTFYLHVWSATRGSSKEVNEIGNLLEAAMAAALTVTGQSGAITRREFREVFVEDDGTRHLVLRYGFRTAEA